MALYRSYRATSARLSSWDYSSPGYYFVTICTKYHRHYFGTIADGDVYLTGIGEIAHSFWQDIPTHFPSMLIDEFVIMPNHVHGILVIQSSQEPVETQHTASLPVHQDASLRKPNISNPAPGSLSAAIRSYKSAVTRWAGKSGFPEFAWQPRFYDHIIRDETSLDRIRCYIRNNPLHWELDRENPRNLNHTKYNHSP